MKSDDPKIRWVEPPKLGMLGKSYLMLFIKGLTTALRHLFFHKKITLAVARGAARDRSIR